MRILGLGITPPGGAQENPTVTPELLASCLARYSRSNKGIDAILGTIDWNDTDASVDKIFRFVDYGHASIAGMTGGIPIVVDGCSMYLAYRLFEFAQQCDGQESSTRYIRLDASSLPSAVECGIPDTLQTEWQSYLNLAFRCYHETYERLDREARTNPSVVRVPEGANDKVVDRLRKNYALDRARYYIPFATKTSAALVMTARAWTDCIRQLDSIPLPETRACAAGLRAELAKFTPRLVRHGMADEASTAQARLLLTHALDRIRQKGVNCAPVSDEVCVSVHNDLPAFLPHLQSAAAAFTGKANRYSTSGTFARRVMVRAAWNNMAIAELRDLNRHRTGFRFSPLAPVGFYLPSEARHTDHDALMTAKKSIITALADSTGHAASYVYGLLLGTQVAFEHSTHLDKFIYEIELRTGLGAHFRYAEHLKAAAGLLLEKMPELKEHISVGTAEPE